MRSALKRLIGNSQPAWLSIRAFSSTAMRESIPSCASGRVAIDLCRRHAEGGGELRDHEVGDGGELFLRREGGARSRAIRRRHDPRALFALPACTRSRKTGETPNFVLASVSLSQSTFMTPTCASALAISRGSVASASFEDNARTPISSR